MTHLSSAFSSSTRWGDWLLVPTGTGSHHGSEVAGLSEITRHLTPNLGKGVLSALKEVSLAASKGFNTG